MSIYKSNLENKNTYISEYLCIKTKKGTFFLLFTFPKRTQTQRNYTFKHQVPIKT